MPPEHLGLWLVEDKVVVRLGLWKIIELHRL
jgi:hypothetical protein